MHDMREDEQIIVPKTGRPLRCGRAIYFRRPELTARVKPSRFFSWGKGSGAQFETGRMPVRTVAPEYPLLLMELQTETRVLVLRLRSQRPASKCGESNRRDAAFIPRTASCTRADSWLIFWW